VVLGVTFGTKGNHRGTNPVNDLRTIRQIRNWSRNTCERLMRLAYWLKKRPEDPTCM